MTPPKGEDISPSRPPARPAELRAAPGPYCLMSAEGLQSVVEQAVGKALDRQSSPFCPESFAGIAEGDTDMANARKIRREIVIGGEKRWVTGANEQEYAENLLRMFAPQISVPAEAPKKEPKPAGHDFRDYAQKWFEVFSKPNVATVTAITYERNLNKHIYPALKGKTIEEIQPADVQNLFNRMKGAKESKKKVKNVLNMIFNQAVEDGLIVRNPLQSKSVRITGVASKATEPYTVEQMRYILGHIDCLSHPGDKTYLALHALHPLRLEEVLGLKGADIDRENGVLHVRRAVTHPKRNMPEIKETKTEVSVRDLDLAMQIVDYLPQVPPDHFVLGGKQPLSYTQVSRMCTRMGKEMNFDGKITPIRFRTTVLTDLYDATKDIKQTQMAAGHSTAAMTLKHYVKGRFEKKNTAAPIAAVYGLKTDSFPDKPDPQKTHTA